MKSNKIETLELVLDKDEIQWLKGIMQNPLFDTKPTDENPKDKEMRKKFWKALGGIMTPDGSLATIRAIPGCFDNLHLKRTAKIPVLVSP